MARKQSKSQSTESEKPSLEATEAASARAKESSLTKADAIRAAIKAGIESPTEAEKYIRKRFGLEVSRTHFSASKSQMRKAENAGAVDGYLAPPKIDAIGDGDLLDALEKMKPLVASLGADKVKRIVDLLG